MPLGNKHLSAIAGLQAPTLVDWAVLICLAIILLLWTGWAEFRDHALPKT